MAIKSRGSFKIVLKKQKKLTKKQGDPQLKEDPNAKDQSTDERVDLDSKGTESLTEEE